MYEEYFEHFPSGISKEIHDFADEVALKGSRYIFTRREGKHQFGYCTHCDTEFRTIGLKHNDIAECPKCKSECTVKASGRGRKKMLDEVYFTYYEKSVLDPKVMIARGIYATRDYRNDYHNVKTFYWQDTLYVFEMGNSVMFKSWYWRKDHYEKCKTVHSLLSYWENKTYIMNSCYSRESIRKAVEGTPFQYSTWERYFNDDMVKFFDLYSKSPCIEYLSKEGYEGIVREKLNGYVTYRTVNWKGKNIFKVLKLTKNEFKAIKAEKIQLSFFFLRVFQDSKKFNWKLSIDEVRHVEEIYECEYESFIAASKYAPIKKALKYFSKQYSDFNGPKWSKHYYHEGSVLKTFLDYMKDCKKLGLDISNEHVLFPKDLYVAHQNTITQVKVKENKILDEQIRKRAMALKKYNYQFGDFLIRPAESSKELIVEGNELHHCVASHYTEKYAKGETNIFFIRKISEPDKPFFTMEIKNNEIKQTHGLRNCLPDEAISEFIQAFKVAKLQTNKQKIKISA